MAEAIEIGERAGARVQISALTRRRSGPTGAGSATRRDCPSGPSERGQDVTFDVYPYTAGSAPLTQIVPDWAHEGGLDALVARLRTHADRGRLAREIAEQGREWDQTLVAWMPDGPGKADEGSLDRRHRRPPRGRPVETLLALLEESSGRGMMVHFVMSEDDVRHVMRHPLAMFGVGRAGADARAGPLAEGKPHPRCYGTYPRILGHYVRETGVLTLEAAVHKAAYRAGGEARARGEGRVQVGADADLVVFDPATVRDPRRTPIRIASRRASSTCWWPGEMTIRDGRHTGARGRPRVRPAALSRR